MKMAIMLSEPEILDAFKSEARNCGFEFVIADKEYPPEKAIEMIARAGADVLVCRPELAHHLAGTDALVLPYAPGSAACVCRTAADMARRCELSASAESAMLASSFCGVIRINSDGIIICANEHACRMLASKNELLAGRYLLNIIPMLDKKLLDAALSDGESVFTLTEGARNSRLMINIEPVKAADGISGAVISIQKSESTAPRSAASVGVDSCAEAGARFRSLSGSSAEFTALVKKAKHAAYTDAPVLLYGENGTEKLELAEYIHSCSARNAASFVELDCSAMTSERLNDILFGSSGAECGCLVERLCGGTLFLNHIEELSQELQFKICRVIIGQMPVYSRLDQRIDVRVIAGTNSSLRAMVKQKRFRDDLYYALNVIPLQIPPLRDRKENIDEYVDYFVGYYSSIYSKPVQLCSGVYDCIRGRRWNGNVKELQNFCQRLVLSASRRSISEAQVRAAFDDDPEQPDASVDAAAPQAAPYDPEGEEILRALRKNNGSRGQTARELGISTTTLWRRMQKHGICDE